MIKKIIIYTILMIMFIVSLQSIVAANVSVHPGDSIQSAVDHASDGDNITVYDNNSKPYTYKESISINKKINIKSSGNVTIEAKNSSSAVFTVNGNGSGSAIQNFILSKSSYCIMINGANNCIISNNNIITAALVGIQFYGNINNSKVFGNTITGVDSTVGNGISFEYGNSTYNNLTGNIISNFLNGILFNDNSENNIVSNNKVYSTGFTGAGIYATDNSRSMQIIGNTVTGAEDAIAIQQMGTNTATNYIISGNTLTSNKNGLWVRINNSTISNNIATLNNVSGLDITGCNNNILNNTASNNGNCGITLSGLTSADYNTVSGNTLNSNQAGINSASNYSTISNNIVYYNTNNGIISTANLVTINNNTVNNNTGALLVLGTNNFITNNILNNNGIGLYLPQSTSADYNTVTGNSINNNQAGINSAGNYSTISNNYLSYNGNNGIISTANHVTINGNTINNTNGSAILVIGTYNNITNNILQNNLIGLTLQQSTNADNNTVSYNNITYNGNGIVSSSPSSNFFYNNLNNNNQIGLTNTGSNCGIVGNSMNYNGEAGLEITSTGNTVMGNRMDYNYYGATFSNCNAATINLNSIVGNTIQVYSPDTSGSLNALNNWWGSNAPSTIRGFNMNPWIVLKLTSNPTQIIRGTTSTITADLTKNSNGADTSVLYPVKYLLNGLTVTFFNDSLGSVNPLVNTTTNGLSITTFTGNTVGSSVVSATVGAQNLSTVVTIIPSTTTATAITVNPVTGFKGDNINLTATLKDSQNNILLVNKNIQFTLNGIIIGSAVTNSQGIATLPYIIILNSGTYNILAQFMADSTYAASNNTNNLQVNSTPTTITVNPITGFKGDTINLIATLTDTHNNVPIVNKNIQFTVNGTLIGNALTNAQGIATLPYTIIQNTGTYNILAQFMADTTYAASNNTNNLQINSTPTAIIVNPISGFKGDTINLIATLTDTHNNIPLTNKNIQFTVNGTLIGSALTNAQGIATLPYTITQNTGTYNLLAQFLTDTTYAASSSVNNLNVGQTPTAIIVNPLNGFEGDTINFIATLTDTHINMPLANKNILFTINGYSLGSALTNAQGIATLPVLLQNTGSYTVLAQFIADTTYAASNNTNNLQVNTIPTTVTINPITGFKGDTINLIATLTDTHNNIPLTNKNVQFTVNGTLIGTAITNAQGIATLLYTIIQNSGTYNILAQFLTDTTYTASNNTNNLQVNSTPTAIIVNPISGFKGDTINLNATLGDTHNNIPLTNKNLQFTINGTLIGSAITNAQGIATLPYTITQNTGTYNILAQFLTDTTYTASNNTNNLQVNSTPTTITVNPISGFKGDTINLIATLTDTHNNIPLTNKNIQFTVNGIIIGTALTNAQGIATLPYTITQNTGTYNILAQFLTDTTYAASSSTNNLNVGQTPTAIIVNPLNGFEGDTINFIATLTDTHINMPLANKSILFTINGYSLGSALTNAQGIATLPILLQNIGSYTVLAQFMADTTYAASNNTNNLQVNTIPTAITVNPITGFKGDTINLIATLTDTHNNIPLANKNVQFTVNGTLIGSAITNAQGIATLPYTIIQNSGTYNILAQFITDTTYTASNNTNNLQVNSTPTTITVNPISGFKGDNINLTAILKDSHNNILLVNKNVQFTLNGIIIGSAITNSQGIATLPYTITQNSGTYNILAQFITDTNYTASNSTNNLQVNSTPTTIVVNPISGFKGDTVNLIATLTDTHSNIPISNKNVQFTVNGTLIGSAITNAQGIATLPYIITQNSGTYNILAQFITDTTYTASNNTNNLNVGQTPTAIIVNPLNGFEGDTINFIATLTDTHINMPLANKNILFTINGYSLGSALTNAQGIATLPVLLQNIGSYTVLAQFMADTTYAASNNTNNLQVNSTPTTITVNPITGFKGDTINLIATLTDTHNNIPLTNKNIQFTINGTLIGTAITNAQGIATLTYTIIQNTGTYNILAQFLTDTTYAASNNSNNLKINSTPTAITVNPITGFKGDTINLIATLTDTHNNIPITNKNLQFTINGTLIGTAVTNSQGIATLPYTITQNSGTYNILAQFITDTTYAASNNTNNLKINSTPTTITVNPITGFKGDTVNLIATLTDTHSNIPISNKNVQFTVNGTLIGSAITNAQGIATLPYTINQNSGTYNILAQFITDTTYAASNNTNNLNVGQTPTAIIVNPITGFKGDTINLIATLTDTHTNTPITNKNIQYTINGTLIGTAITNAQGIATLPILLQNIGSYTVLAQFLTDTNYAASNNTNNLQVNSIPTAITTTPIIGVRGKTINVTATLSDAHNKIPLANKNIQFSVNNISIGSAITNSQGIATLPYIITQNSGTYNILAQFLADDTFAGQTNTFKLTVDNIAPTVSITTPGGLYNTSKTIYLNMSEAGTIYYTLNGTSPTNSSTKYISGLSITSNKTLKYFAVDLAGNKSPIYSQTYTIDKVAPNVSSTSPTNLQTGVSRTSAISIKFNENIKSSANYQKITVKNTTTNKYVTVTLSIKGNVLYINTSDSRKTNNWYLVSIPAAAIKDYAGNDLKTDYTFKFKSS